MQPLQRSLPDPAMDAPQPPGPAPGHARTKLDLLYHDVLGEVASLVDRLEAVSASLDAAQQQIQAVADTQQILPQQLARHLATTLEATARPIHLQHRQAIQRLFEHGFPARTQFGLVDAAIDHCPAFTAIDAIAQQPQIDVIQGERQAHADPAHTGRHVLRTAGLGQSVAPGVVQFVFQRIHAMSP